MLSFESLGERCDFGAVQRKFGVEPLGLLRFAYSKYDALIAGLEDRLAAVGSVEDTGFELYNDENILIMKKYGLVFHTFVDQNELATEEKRDRFRQQQRRRLGFLRDKLVADLEEPQKIYIYSSEERVVRRRCHPPVQGAARLWPQFAALSPPGDQDPHRGNGRGTRGRSLCRLFRRACRFCQRQPADLRAVAAVVRTHLPAGREPNS